MKKIFIAYSDANCAYSLERIGKQAKRLGFFDEVILYKPDTLPEFIKNSPLMEYKMGGGLWSWKPAIIKHTLDISQEGDIVVYADAGCTLNPSPSWDYYFEQLKSHDTIVFEYHKEMSDWAKFGQSSPKLAYWCKPSAAKILESLYNNKAFLEKNVIWGGLVFAKSKKNSFVNNWLDLTLNHPELITPASQEERQCQIEGFCFHCHDQAVMTAVANNDSATLILPEDMETGNGKTAIVASRYRCKTRMDYIKERTKRTIRKLFGESLYNNIKSKLK